MAGRDKVNKFYIVRAQTNERQERRAKGGFRDNTRDPRETILQAKMVPQRDRQPHDGYNKSDKYNGGRLFWA